MSEVIDNPAEHRFELPIEESAIAAAYYSFAGERIVLTHTIVPKQFEGRGVASRLARGVFDAIRASGREVVLECPFMTAYYERHPEYSDIVFGATRSGDTR
jgi:predicted GNAT family acetyltransferase